jgi:hypothetical protein
MRRRVPAWLAVVALAALAITAGGRALAYFAGAGSGTATAAVTSLGGPTISAATPAAGGTVTLTWGAITPPGSGTVAYYVTRDGGEPAGNCPTKAAPSTVVTCKDASVPVGEHSYRIVSRWQSWTATGAAKAATVTIGEAVKFTISGSTTTPATGAAVNLTITAKDSANTTVTSYTGAHNVVFSGASAGPNGDAPTVVNSSGTAVELGSPTALTFSSGVASVASSKNGVLKVYRAGPASITATSESLTTPAPLELTVSATATQFTLEATTPTPALGAADDTKITAFDAFGNVATSYTGSKSLVFSGASSSPGGNAPTVTNSSGTAVAFGSATAITFSAGVAESSKGVGGRIVLYKAGTTEIKATQSSVTTPKALVLTPPLGATSRFILSAATTTPAAGASDELTIAATDTYGNTTPSYTGSKSLIFSGANPSGGGNAPTITNSSGTAVAFGSATAITFTAGLAESSTGGGGKAVLYKVETASLKATQESITTPTGLTVTPTPGTAAKLALSSSTTTPVAGTAFNLTTTAQDTYGNTATSYTGAKSITFGGAVASPSGTLPTVVNNLATATNFGTATALTFTNGVATVSESKNGVARLYKSGATSVTASDSTISTATALALTVSTAAASRVAVSGLVASAGAIGSPCLFTCAVTTLGNSGTIKAKATITDANGNVVSGIGATKSVAITSTGGTITGSPLSIPASGSAISSTEFTYTAPASETYNNTITLASTGYISATVTASK